MPLTSYASKKLADHVLSINAYAMPSQIWFGLHKASPTVLGLTSFEVPLVGTGYARINLTGLMSPADVITGLSQLLSPLVSPIATADWGTITHASISDAPVAGNMLFFTEMDASQVIVAGQQFQRVPGQLQVRLL